MEKVKEYYEFILPLVLEAGKVLLKADTIEVEFKKEQVWDLVTEFDRRIEEVLIKKIKETYPTHKHIGEEETDIDSVPKLTDDPTWIIDPIDGTVNFTRKMPLTGISVGLTIEKQQVMGIVYNPYMNELFTAIKGQGAFLNGKRIRTSGLKEIQKAVMNYEISLARRDEQMYNLYMYRFKHLIKMIQGFRSLGCAILGLCYVACGRTDAYQGDGIYPWDVAAGSLIVTEAGGHVVDSSSKEFDLMNPNILATSTKELSDQFMEIERRADDERINKVSKNKSFTL